MRKLIKIDDIILDAGTQVRADIHRDVVDDYSDAFKSKAKFPPIDAFHDGGKYLLADGFHRVMGASKAGLKQIECEIHQGDRAACIKFALSANAHHGIRRTNADKRHAVEIALKEFPKLSNVALAEICSVSEFLVRDLRPSNLDLIEVDKRVGRDGKERKLPPVPTPKKSPPVPQPPPKPQEKPSTPPLPQPKSKPPIEPDVLDETGHPIPPKIVPLWNEAQEVQELLTAISRIKGVLRKAQDEKDKVFAEVNFSSALSMLDQAYTDIKTAKPFAVCTSCQGMVPAQCTFCKGRGFISQFRFDTCAPREVKEIRFKSRK